MFALHEFADEGFTKMWDGTLAGSFLLQVFAMKEHIYLASWPGEAHLALGAVWQECPARTFCLRTRSVNQVPTNS